MSTNGVAAYFWGNVNVLSLLLLDSFFSLFSLGKKYFVIRNTVCPFAQSGVFTSRNVSLVEE